MTEPFHQEEIDAINKLINEDPAKQFIFWWMKTERGMPVLVFVPVR